MNIIKAVKTANKVNKVKKKAAKGLNIAKKVLMTGAVAGLAVYTAVHIKKKRKAKRNLEQLANTKAAKGESLAIELKKQKNAKKITHKKNKTHGTQPKAEIPEKTINI